VHIRERARERECSSRSRVGVDRRKRFKDGKNEGERETKIERIATHAIATVPFSPHPPPLITLNSCGEPRVGRILMAADSYSAVYSVVFVK